MSVELKPCPFCGNEFPVLRMSSMEGYYKIECPQCDTRFTLGAGEKQKIRDRIVAAWNRRTGE